MSGRLRRLVITFGRDGIQLCTLYRSPGGLVKEGEAISVGEGEAN